MMIYNMLSESYGKISPPGLESTLTDYSLVIHAWGYLIIHRTVLPHSWESIVELKGCTSLKDLITSTKKQNKTA